MLTVGAFPGTIGNMTPYFASYIRQVIYSYFETQAFSALQIILLVCLAFKISTNTNIIFFPFSTHIDKKHYDFILKIGQIDDVRYFPKGVFPSGNFPRVFSQVATSQMCNMPSSNFLNKFTNSHSTWPPSPS